MAAASFGSIRVNTAKTPSDNSCFSDFWFCHRMVESFVLLMASAKASVAAAAVSGERFPSAAAASARPWPSAPCASRIAVPPAATVPPRCVASDPDPTRPARRTRPRSTVATKPDRSAPRGRNAVPAVPPGAPPPARSAEISGSVTGSDCCRGSANSQPRASTPSSRSWDLGKFGIAAVQLDVLRGQLAVLLVQPAVGRTRRCRPDGWPRRRTSRPRRPRPPETPPPTSRPASAPGFAAPSGSPVPAVPPVGPHRLAVQKPPQVLRQLARLRVSPRPAPWPSP